MANIGLISSGITGMECARERGIVWCADLAASSALLNDNHFAGDVEAFLPRLYFVATGLAEISGASFLKWTGDGFLAWYATPLHRLLGEQAARVLTSAAILTRIIDETQLETTPRRPFSLRHGIAGEQDALLMHRGTGVPFDVIGRGVVFASRLASLPAPAASPGIVTQTELVRAARPYLSTAERRALRFLRRRVSSDEKLRVFKGEDWAIDGICASAPARDPFPGRDARGITDRLLDYLHEGPDWCHPILRRFTQSARQDLPG